MKSNLKRAVSNEVLTPVLVLRASFHEGGSARVPHGEESLAGFDGSG